ncbi:MAG: dipicolinate synthase subunit B [Bacillota bacterium]|nr:dipicolinate synthase subunit B [Bacillota bacterium]
MKFHGIKIGLALTGSHCTIDEIFSEVEKLVTAGSQIFPIISPAVRFTSTRFGEAKEIKEHLEKMTGNRIIRSIAEAEPIGPQKLFDILAIAPCTGNTLAKLAHGITDTAVLMAAKAHLRNQLPVVLSIATNDGLGINAKNIGLLLATKNIFMVPFGQDDPLNKPNSLISRVDLLLPTIEKALQREQLQPLLHCSSGK